MEVRRQDLAGIVSRNLVPISNSDVAIKESPQIGSFTIYSPYAEMVDATLKVLFESVIHRNANEVRVRWAYRREGKAGLWLTIDVIDNGRKLEPTVFDGHSSLAQLRRKLRGLPLRGDIAVWETTEGTMVRLELQLFR